MTTAYFRKAEHVCGIDKEGHFLVSFGRFEHETSQKSMQI